MPTDSRSKRTQRRCLWYPTLLLLFETPHASNRIAEKLGISGHDASLILQRLRVRGWVKHDAVWHITKKGKWELFATRLITENPDEQEASGPRGVSAATTGAAA